MEDNPKARIPENNKKPGVCYAVTNDGVELPVIDVTHPAFALDVGAEALAAQRDAFTSVQLRRRRMPRFMQRMLYRFLLRKSVLWKGLSGASSAFLGGMNTYLLKLGPDNLGSGYIGQGDRMIASSFPATALRLRLQHTATLLAEGIAALLSSRPGAPLNLVDIAGGHAADSLNALILVRRSDPELLSGRKITIHVLDLERAAPDFGCRALAALLGSGPLTGLDTSFKYERYDWKQTRDLDAFLGGLGRDSVTVVSSEGGLFDYGTDAEITANLDSIRAAALPGVFVVGSVTRDDEFNRQMHRYNRIPVIHRGIGRFGSLIGSVGWTLDKVVELPFSDVVRISPPTPKGA